MLLNIHEVLYNTKSEKKPIYRVIILLISDCMLA